MPSVRGNCFSEEEMMLLPAHRLFSVVLDVEKYPEFLPWCKDVKVLSRGESFFVAEVVAGFLALSGKYTSHVLFCLPADKSPGWVKVQSVDGVFKFLRSEWQFLPFGEEKTLVKFSIDFSFRRKVLQLAFDMASDIARRRLMRAFRERTYRLFNDG
ncbi:MAG: type II toxin-antitoxin system RatA family toxin [Anaplasma sp.]